jgi:hypothetical protein
MEDDMLFRTAALTLTLTTAFGLAACGAARHDDDASAVRAVTVGYLQDLVAGDSARACGRLTDAARHTVTVSTGYSCEDAVRQVHDLATPEQRFAVAGVKVNRVTFADDHRKAIVADEDVTVPSSFERIDNGRPTVLLKQRDGHWLIQDLGA